MRESELPSPNIGPRGFHLRRVAAQALSQLDMIAPRYPNGAHPSAADLKTFFDACSAEAARIGANKNPPANTAVPTISGTAQVGATLTAANGTWTGDPAPTLTRQWKANGVAISGATGATYVPVEGDIGKVITVTVTGVNTSGTASATSAATAAVIAASEG